MTGISFEPGHPGRAGSPGCVTSGRRWHRRIPAGNFTIRSRPTFPRNRPGIGGRIMTKAPCTAVALLGAILITGCAARSVQVAQLKDQPAKYYDKTVSVSGVVTNSWGLPLVPFQFYSVDDGTGQITIV